MLRVVYHPEAEAEVIAAARFYEERVPGLGADLLDEIDRGVATILEEPTPWRPFVEDFRRYSIKRFPYAIVYRIHSDGVRILAVAHHSRSPEYWRDRPRT